MPEFETSLPPYVRARLDGPADCSDLATDDDALAGEDAASLDESAPLREGLPPSFRMRTDPHYVETLYTRQDDQPSAVGRDEGVLAIVRELSVALHAIGASTSDLSMQGRSLRERAALTLVRAEAQRAAWLADTASAVVHDPTCALDTVSLADVVRRVAAAIEPAQRLTGVEPTVYIADVPTSVAGDPRLLEAAIGGIVVAMGAILEERGLRGRLAIRLTAGAGDPAQRSIEVSQAGVALPARTLARFFDGPSADHPAGRIGALHLAAAQRIARVHRGRLAVSPIETGGCTVTFTLKSAG